MEESVDRELEAILNLVKLTQDGTVKWHTAKPWGDLIQDETTKYTNVMHCEFKDKWLRLFIEKHRVDKPKHNTLAELALSNIYYNQDRAYPYWAEWVVLEISNSAGQSLWRFPSKPATKDLLDAAKYQVAGVKDVLDSLLQRPST